MRHTSASVFLFVQFNLKSDLRSGGINNRFAHIRQRPSAPRLVSAPSVHNNSNSELLTLVCFGALSNLSTQPNRSSNRTCVGCDFRTYCAPTLVGSATLAPDIIRYRVWWNYVRPGDRISHNLIFPVADSVGRGDVEIRRSGPRCARSKRIRNPPRKRWRIMDRGAIYRSGYTLAVTQGNEIASDPPRATVDFPSRAMGGTWTSSAL